MNKLERNAFLKFVFLCYLLSHGLSSFHLKSSNLGWELRGVRGTEGEGKSQKKKPSLLQLRKSLSSDICNPKGEETLSLDRISLLWDCPCPQVPMNLEKGASIMTGTHTHTYAHTRTHAQTHTHTHHTYFLNLNPSFLEEYLDLSHQVRSLADANTGVVPIYELGFRYLLRTV